MHQEAITLKAGQLLSALIKFKPLKNFCLVGGTALALQIGHRVSVDFDWFGQKPLPKNLLKQIKDFFSGRKILVDVLKTEELTVRIDGVQITFLQYPFPWTEKPLPQNGFFMASVGQIAAMKAQTINRRSVLKDYVDLYFIFKNRYADLNDIINKSKTAFKEEFNPRLFLEQLVYMEDIADEKMEFLKNRPDKQKIQKFFENLVKKVKI